MNHTVDLGSTFGCCVLQPDHVSYLVTSWRVNGNAGKEVKNNEQSVRNLRHILFLSCNRSNKRK